MKSFVLYFHSEFHRFVPNGPIDKKSGNGLAPNRRQAITWTNADPVHWRIYVALGEDKLVLKLHHLFIIVSVWSPRDLHYRVFACFMLILFKWQVGKKRVPFTCCEIQYFFVFSIILNTGWLRSLNNFPQIPDTVNSLGPRPSTGIELTNRSPVNSPHKGQRHGAMVLLFDLRLNKRLSKQSIRRKCIVELWELMNG